MTAEVAILNRAAIAFAADSAVTISIGTKNKVYDTAEKLFELSCKQPLALMIYNNVEYVGVPFDVLIRKFRAEKDAAGHLFASMEEVSKSFLDYMQGFEHDIDEERKYLYALVAERFTRINKLMTTRLRRVLKDLASGKITSPPSGDGILRELVREHAETESARPLAGYLLDITLTKFRASFSDVVRKAANELFKSVDIEAATYRELDRLALAMIKNNVGSDLLTGLVFGGFSTADMFPTMRYVEIDGVFFGKIKVLSVEEIDIDRKKTRAAVVPFAQKEMVERFMYGLDTELEDEISSFVSEALTDVLETTSKDLSTAKKEALKAKVHDRFTSMMTELKESSRQDLLDIVYFMSKKELADIAYALVELTSQKRRFSTEEQSVGGPIDVAILTKSEGFIWIKRKHYFDEETNPRYRSRLSH